VKKIVDKCIIIVYNLGYENQNTKIKMFEMWACLGSKKRGNPSMPKMQESVLGYTQEKERRWKDVVSSHGRKENQNLKASHFNKENHKN